jgi:NAD(P)-dependent dehydrogenase (short-subunit alcohol dehydrogenase family)
MELAGKTAIVTGGSSGIGLATARLFAKEGARVGLVGRDAKALAEAKAALGAAAEIFVADVAKPGDLDALRKQAEAAYGGIDILFANAGVAFATPLGATDEATYDTLMDINAKGVFFTVQALLPLMREGGSIVLNTSWLADVGTAGLAVLSASKAAVRSFARTMSAELLDRRIRVNAVSPGAIATPIHGKIGMAPDALKAFAERIAGAIPLHRFGEADDVAQAALFLAGPRSTYMLGGEIAVDGGFAQI